MKNSSIKNIFLLLIIAIASSSCLKQSLYIAQDYQKEYRYADAIGFYKRSLEKQPSKEGVKGLAECYRILRNYPMAEVWYGKAYAMDNRNPEVTFQYAMMLKANGKYEEAKQFFGYFKQYNPNDSLLANEQIKGCDLAVAWQEKPRDYRVIVRDDISSDYSDFGFQRLDMNGEESFVFSTNRPVVNSQYGIAKENQEPYFELLGARMNDQRRVDQIYEFKIGKNFPYHVATPTFSANYDTVFYTQTPISKTYKESLNRLEIFYSIKNGAGEWTDPIPFQYNNRAHSNSHPYLSKDGKSLYFISDAPGGFGGFDIYVSKLVDGIWTTPDNLGSTINTKENEFYPIFEDNTLYFSSLGHVGMGGLDIFESKKVGTSWSTPVNLEFPLNSSQDDFAFVNMDEKKENEGFLSSNRVGGKGADDIYSFSYIEPLPPVYMVTMSPEDMDGNVISTANSSNFAVFERNDPSKMANQYTDETGQNYYLLETDQKYKVKASVPGYLEETMPIIYDQLEILDTVLIKKELPKQYGFLSEFTLNLKEIKVGKEYNINNIYFDFNSDNIRESAKIELIQLANVLLANQGFSLEIGSHCDARGSDSYNLALSKRRAKSVMRYLINKGVSKQRLSFKGYGETQILNECVNGVICTDALHEQNRRTTFKIVDVD